MGIKGFWDMVNIAENERNEHLSMRDHVMQVPPVGRVRCLEALMAEVEAAPPPESLRHSVDTQDKIDIMAEYRGMLERVLRKHMLHVWQSCARQLFAAADPVKFIAGGASGINADAPRGLDEKDVADRELLDTISTLELDRWPNWYTAQYDALVVQPGRVDSVLNNDENQPARVWREGRAKASGASVRGRLQLYPKDVPGQRVSKPKKTNRKGIPVQLEPWIGGWQPVAGSELLYPPPGIGSAQVLPGIIAGNPEEVRTLPWLFVTKYPGTLEYAHVPLAPASTSTGCTG